MNKKLIVLAAALLVWSAAFSQIHKMERSDSSMTSRTYNLNPVVVTGSGHHQRLKSTATPVHVLGSQEIREQGITTFDGALQRMMPQVSMAPNSMGSQLRLNGLGNKYILILINGQKLSGDISNNVDLNRINMSRDVSRCSTEQLRRSMAQTLLRVSLISLPISPHETLSI